MNDINPFHVLYVTDSPDPSTFVELFSDYPVRFSHPMFQPGNVVLKGTQGSGKSMLLNLLRPEIRQAYAAARAQMPLPSKLQSFVSAGINLTLSGALDIGQRPLSKDSEGDDSVFPLLFGDFVNYFIVRDLLRSLSLIGDNRAVFHDLVDPSRLDGFARSLASDECWFGYLHDVVDYNSLCLAIDRRLACYRAFHQFNGDLPQDIQTTKTRIGFPIARADDILKNEAVVAPDVPLFVRIDQLERLHRSDILRPFLGQQYRRIINKALGQRDSRVSYRIGTRRYAWDDDLTIYGTHDRLEHLRDFRIIDIDDKMRRKENSKTWLFPAFASDAFRRRLRHEGITFSNSDDPMRCVFGGEASSDDLARQYTQSGAGLELLRLNDGWSSSWKDMLSELVEGDPFTAMLATAWAKQEGGKSLDRHLVDPPKDRPWQKPYWKKERVRQCLMQIAARKGQRLRWFGKESVVSLSTPNISVFLSVCHEIWDAYLRSEQRGSSKEKASPIKDGIHRDIQTVGIQTASQEWYDKIAEQPHGHDRQRFVDVLGRHFRTWLLEDEAMSYPGHNGFSLEIDELREHPALLRFLQDASDYGDLYESEHTTRNKDRKQRRKWYLNPILSVYFQIPEAHPKEPRYVKVADLAGWLAEAKVVLQGFSLEATKSSVNATGEKPVRGDSQRLLFPNESREDQ